MLLLIFIPTLAVGSIHTQHFDWPYQVEDVSKTILEAAPEPSAPDPRQYSAPAENYTTMVRTHFIGFSEGNRIGYHLPKAGATPESDVFIIDLDLAKVEIHEVPTSIPQSASFEGWTSTGALLFLKEQKLFIGKDEVILPEAPFQITHYSPPMGASIHVNPAQDCYAFHAAPKGFGRESALPSDRNNAYLGFGWSDPPKKLQVPDYFWHTEVTAISPSCSVALRAFDGRSGEWGIYLYQEGEILEVPPTMLPVLRGDESSLYREETRLARFIDENHYVMSLVRHNSMAGFSVELTDLIFQSSTGSWELTGKTYWDGTEYETFFESSVLWPGAPGSAFASASNILPRPEMNGMSPVLRIQIRR